VYDFSSFRDTLFFFFSLHRFIKTAIGILTSGVFFTSCKKSKSFCDFFLPFCTNSSSQFFNAKLKQLCQHIQEKKITKRLTFLQEVKKHLM